VDPPAAASGVGRRSRIDTGLYARWEFAVSCVRG
jgi:hypothetical protein